MGGGILPVARYQGTLLFLFGREVGDGKWSDFGGGKEHRESPFQTAIREGAEELNGFLGSEAQLTKAVKKDGVLRIDQHGFSTFLFEVDYDQNLPLYFKNNSRFIKKHLSHLINRRNGLFEKSEIDWFTTKDLQNSRHLFRNFYKKTVDRILENERCILGRMSKR